MDPVEVLHEFYAAFNERRYADALRHVAPDFQLRPGVTGFDVLPRYRGHQGFMDFLETIVEPWEGYTVEPIEIAEAPGGRLVAVERWRVRTQTGLEIDTQIIDVYDFRDGLVTRVEGYRNRAEAFAAAGMPSGPHG